jgi:hypothetical protein
MEEVKEVTEAKEVRDSEALCFGMATFFCFGAGRQSGVCDEDSGRSSTIWAEVAQRLRSFGAQTTRPSGQCAQRPMFTELTIRPETR